VDNKGRYAGTITEGDLLWKLKNTPGLSFEGTEKVMLPEVPKQMNNEPVLIDARVKDLLSVAMSQNFIPVVDDQNTFIGIVRRRDNH
jgi:CBS domain-containing protein